MMAGDIRARTLAILGEEFRRRIGLQGEPLEWSGKRAP
jgi:hypothetical protein